MFHHTACHRRKRVAIVLHDGTRFVDRFLDRTKGRILFEVRGFVPLRAIRSFGINDEAKRYSHHHPVAPG